MRQLTLIVALLAALVSWPIKAAEPTKSGLVGTETGESGASASQVFNVARIKVGSGTGTCSTNAVTINRAAGVITTEALTTAAGGTYTCTLTSNKIAAGDMVFGVVDANGSAGQPSLASVTVTGGSGTAAFVIQNIHASAALDSAVKIYFLVVTSGNPN